MSSDQHIDGFCRARLHDLCANSLCTCPCHEPHDDRRQADQLLRSIEAGWDQAYWELIDEIIAVDDRQDDQP